MKLYLILGSIPPHIFGRALSDLSSKLIYQIMKCCTTNNEYEFLKRIIYQDLSMPRKKVTTIPLFEFTKDKGVENMTNNTKGNNALKNTNDDKKNNNIKTQNESKNALKLRKTEIDDRLIGNICNENLAMSSFLWINCNHQYEFISDFPE